MCWIHCCGLSYRQSRMGNLPFRPNQYHSDRERDIHDGNDSLLFHDLCPQGAAYVVMCYNLHGIGTEPGPKADLAFLRDLYKRFEGLPSLSFALANGGFDWEEASGNAVSLTEGQAAALAEAHHVLPRRDAASGALSFPYTEGSTRHRVWYADSETLARWAAELDTCAGKTVPISIWRIN